MPKRTCPWIWGRVSCTWDPMTGRYEGIHGSALVGMLYCCICSDGRIRGCPDQTVGHEEGGSETGVLRRYGEGWLCWGMKECDMHCVRDLC